MIKMFQYNLIRLLPPFKPIVTENDEFRSLCNAVVKWSKCEKVGLRLALNSISTLVEFVQLFSKGKFYPGEYMTDYTMTFSKPHVCMTIDYIVPG